MRNKLLLKSPDGKKAVSILEAALGLSRTYPDMSIEMLASVKAVPVPVEQPVKPKMDTSGLTLEQLLQLAAEWGVTVPVGSAREDVLALLKAA